jgi:hypothetical protein
MASHAYRIVNVFTQGLTAPTPTSRELGVPVAALFGGWCLAMQQSLPLRYEISQGEMTGRPSTLYLEVASDRHIRVSGGVVDLAQVASGR